MIDSLKYIVLGLCAAYFVFDFSCFLTAWARKLHQRRSTERRSSHPAEGPVETVPGRGRCPPTRRETTPSANLKERPLSPKTNGP